MTEVDLRFLDEEREKLWQRILELETKISSISEIAENAKVLAENKVSADEAMAKSAALSATSYSQTAEAKSNEISTLFSEITPIITEFKQNKTLLINAIDLPPEKESTFK